jgi:acyl carrier protein
LQLLGTIVSKDDPLMAAGLDSLVGTQFVQAVSERYCTEFPSTLVFDHPTLESIAEYLTMSKDSACSEMTNILDALVASALQLLGTIVSKDDPLMAAGLDSLAGTQFAQAVSERYCTEFPSTLVFDHPTLESIAKFLAQ